MSASLSIILDKRRIKQKTKKYPVKLRVTYQRKSKLYCTIYDLSEEEFGKLNAPNVGAGLKAIRNKLRDIEREADNSIRAMTTFHFDDFEKEYISNNPLFNQKGRQNVTVQGVYGYDVRQYAHRFPIFKELTMPAGTILVSFRAYIDKLLRADRIGTAVCYQTSYYALEKFRGNVSFSDVTVDYLNDFERWMLRKNSSKTTIGIYVRSLRCIFNEAIEDGIIKRDRYPFGRRRYQVPTSRNVKKALTLDDVSKFYYYQPTRKEEQWAKDFWFFSYLGNGINPKDIACLKYKNIEGDYFIFERAKTEKATRCDPKPITVFITEDMRAIIDRWANKDKNPNNYVFPMLKPEITALRQYELIELFTQSINDWLLKIKKKLGIEKRLTTYVARHTFSTVLKRSGVSTEFIQESLGHTNIRTTEKYLDSFEREVKRDLISNLTTFKKVSAAQEDNEPGPKVLYGEGV
jgi:integrase/recombinase XerD